MADPREDLREYERKRNFQKTAEPRGGGRRRSTGALAFVIQKHAASHLHYDLRLEMGGTMKSWAVPKGPSLDPSVKRLAVEVEDHPMEYNDFEGTIPQGEYGGGTVMLWDRGTYEVEEKRKGETDEAAGLRSLRKGKLSFTVRGERLQGSYSLVRTGRAEGGRKPQWLLIKQSDAHADPEVEITEEVETSVASGRTMEEIAAGTGGARTWHSNRAPKPGKRTTSRPGSTAPASDLQPMLAQGGADAPPSGDWIYEPKYDGIRVLAFATPEQAALVTRNGHDKARQFPEVAARLRELSSELGEPLVLDGEVVALSNGEILRFEALQGRMHVTSRAQIERLAEEQPAGLVAFDLLLAGDDVLVHEPWRTRRQALERVLEGADTGTLRISEVSTEPEALRARAEREGWEGLIAKRPASPYRPGKRSRDWLKIKLEARQEFIVGGWTEPRRSRKHLGAILLGYYDPEGNLVYAGHTGGGFSAQTLEEMYRRLSRLERKTSPFKEKPRTNEKAHWTTPRVVVVVKFNEWTKEGKLRQPTFVGFRDDKDPSEVVREPVGPGRVAREERATAPEPPPSPIAERIRKVAASKTGGGRLPLGGGEAVTVTNLPKVFFPRTGHTKGDLLEYYARMADVLLPWMRDRPLVLKRFPNGVEGESFYQQAAPEDPPEGVRVEMVSLGDGEPQPRLVGGNLATLLYTVQLGAISYDPWHSRVQQLETADYTILDLDPGEGATFRTVVDVARRVRDEMDELGLEGALKTSGSSGLHVYLPLPPGTPLEAATLVAQIVATRVARRHPKQATVKRMRRDRAPGTIYVDYLQNILGKTVAGVYAVRAKPEPTVSTPLRWSELTDDLDLRDFTMDTVPRRVAEIGDLWAPAMEKPIDLEGLLALAT